jgi:Spy/CpxP family protein refolding chaperone
MTTRRKQNRKTMKRIGMTLCLLGMLTAASAQVDENDSLPGRRPQQDQRPEMGPHRKHLTVDQVNERMVKELNLTEQQQKKVAKLNKSYKELIEGPSTSQTRAQGQSSNGGGMGGPGGGMGGPGGGMGGPGGGMGGNFGGGMGGPGGMGGGMAGKSGSQSGKSAGNSNLPQDLSKKQARYDQKLKKILTEEQYTGYEKIKKEYASQTQYRDFLLNGSQLPDLRKDQSGDSDEDTPQPPQFDDGDGF